MFTALIQNLVILLLLLLLNWVFIGTGLLILKRLNITFSGTSEKLLPAFGLGAAITGYLVFLLAATQLLYPQAFYALLALLLPASAAGWRKSGGSLSLRNVSPPRGVVEWLAATLLVMLLGAAFIMALAPETGRDALIYHLAVPKLFLKHHGFYFIPGNAFANNPFHTELLFLLALFLKGDVLAKLIHFTFFLAILLGIRQFALRHSETTVFPYLSMLIFALIPSVFFEAHTAYVDLAVAFYTMSALFAYTTWHERQERGWLGLCAVFTGMALATKYTTLILPFIGCLGVLWGHRHDEKARPAGRDLFLYVAITLLFGAPFYVKNWLVTGNPFYPFLYGIFGGKGWEPEQARLYDAMVLYYGMGREAIDYLLLPWNLSFHAKMDTIFFDGVISPLFLCVLPFLAGVRKIPVTLKIIMVYCVLAFMFWASASQQIRFLIPIFPFLAILSGSVLTYYRRNKGLALLLSVAVVGCLTFNAYLDVLHFERFSPFGVVFGREEREAFLERTLDPYPMYRYVNDNLPPDAKVFLIFMKNWTFLCDRECYSDYMFEYYTLQKVLAASASPDEVYRRLKEMGFTHIMYDSNHVTGSKSMLSPTEIELFAAFQKKRLTLLKNSGDYYLFSL
jgi:hypothetical protein